MGKRNVAILVSTELSYGRGVIDGLARYIQLQTHWGVAFHPFANDWTPSRCRQLDADGVIICSAHGAIRSAIADLGKPAVDVSTEPAYPQLPQVTVDSSAIGTMAAEYFLERNFRHFAVLGKDAAYTRPRQDSFIERLDREGYAASVHVQMGDVTAIARWLEALPRPVAVFAATDPIGRLATFAAQRVSLRVPEDVALLAFGNNKQMCELADPPLSSIIPPAEEIGLAAAAWLEKMMNGYAPPASPLLTPPPAVAERQSSDIVAVSDALLGESLRFIRENATHGIHVDDVARHMAVTRRSIERRFRNHLARSPRSEILRVQLNHARRLLSLTQLPIAKVAEQSGFHSHVRFTTAFRKEAGLPPIEYRRRHQRQSGGDDSVTTP